MTWTSLAIKPRMIRRTGLSGISLLQLLGCPKASRRDRSCRTAASKSAPPVRCTAAPAPRQTVRFIITCLNLFALDTKLDVKPTADAFETRANVMKAMQGHILGKAVYGGLFRRPQ